MVHRCNKFDIAVFHSSATDKTNTELRQYGVNKRAAVYWSILIKCEDNEWKQPHVVTYSKERLGRRILSR